MPDLLTHCVRQSDAMCPRKKSKISGSSRSRCPKLSNHGDLRFGTQSLSHGLFDLLVAHSDLLKSGRETLATSLHID